MPGLTEVFKTMQGRHNQCKPGFTVVVAAGARGTAKTHLPTDEASLKQLQMATGHELPGLVLEYR
jgi:hypothetical protein